MKSLKELLKSTSFVKYESFRLDKTKRPEEFKCLNCGKDMVGWFWLESECPEILPSHWERQLCRCAILHALRAKRSYLAFGINRPAENMSARQIDKAKDKIARINETIKRIEEMSGNSEYYRARVEMADDITSFADEEISEIIWSVLFGCKDKAEAEFYQEIINVEQPK